MTKDIGFGIVQPCADESAPKANRGYATALALAESLHRYERIAFGQGGMMADTKGLPADVVVDVQGELCPMPVIQASRALKALKSGQVLKLLASDPGSTADVPALAEALGHTLVKTETSDDLFTFWIRKS